MVNVSQISQVIVKKQKNKRFLMNYVEQSTKVKDQV